MAGLAVAGEVSLSSSVADTQADQQHTGHQVAHTKCYKKRFFNRRRLSNVVLISQFVFQVVERSIKFIYIFVHYVNIM